MTAFDINASTQSTLAELPGSDIKGDQKGD